jgi:hypothetical protein
MYLVGLYEQQGIRTSLLRDKFIRSFTPVLLASTFPRPGEELCLRFQPAESLIELRVSNPNSELLTTHLYMNVTPVLDLDPEVAVKIFETICLER